MKELLEAVAIELTITQSLITIGTRIINLIIDWRVIKDRLDILY